MFISSTPRLHLRVEMVDRVRGWSKRPRDEDQLQSEKHKHPQRSQLYLWYLQYCIMGSFLTPLLIGKVAAVTGGTTGIGRAIVLEYVRQGCNVAVNHLGLDRDEKFRASLVDEVAQIRKDAARQGNNTTGELLEIAGDICLPATSKNLVEATVQRWGKLDVFVANAGIFKPAAFLE